MRPFQRGAEVEVEAEEHHQREAALQGEDVVEVGYPAQRRDWSRKVSRR